MAAPSANPTLPRSADACSIPYFVLTVPARWLVSQITAAAKQGKRRWVDPHWLGGNRFLKIG